MLNNADAAALMQDARAMQADGERQLALGDWRDAAEKGCLAVRNATAAAVLEVTGVDNQTTSHINAGLRKLARERGSEWAELRKDYGEAAHLLHSQAFYKGVYDNDVPVLVRGAADYIRQVEELAG